MKNALVVVIAAFLAFFAEGCSIRAGISGTGLSAVYSPGSGGGVFPPSTLVVINNQTDWFLQVRANAGAVRVKNEDTGQIGLLMIDPRGSYSHGFRSRPYDYRVALAAVTYCPEGAPKTCVPGRMVTRVVSVYRDGRYQELEEWNIEPGMFR
jgi:hypothetical protein